MSAVWVSTIATYTAPSTAEITAGTDYKNQIASMDGFAPASTTVDQPNLGNRVSPNIPGVITLGEGTVVFNLAKAAGTTDARTTFVDGTDGVTSATAGFWVFSYEGIVASGKCRVFPATVSSATPTSDIANPFMLTVTFALTLPPSGFIALPTA
jgi:hypothetical protein